MTKLTEVEFNNKAKVIGKVSENKLEVVPNAKRKVNGKEITDSLIKGSIVIQTGENETNEVFVEFLYKTTRAGDVNKKFAGLETLAAQLKTIKEAGYENADTVEVSNALFVTDTYNGRDGRNSKDKFKINSFSGFINRKENLDESLFGATVDLDVVISNIKPEFKTVDDEQEETGRIIVEGHYLNVYNGNATTTGATKFVVADENGAEYIQSVFKNLSFAELAVDVVNFQEKKEVVTERGFGKPKVETSYNYKRENLIVGADPKTDTNKDPIVFEREELEKSIQALEQKLAEKENKANNNNTQSARSQGFGGQSAAKPKQSLSDDPFNPFG